MAARCTAEQVTKAIVMWSVDNDNNLILVNEIEDVKNVKCLDLLLSTLDVFRDCFDERFDNAYVKYKKQISLSKQHFVDYLRPRCLLLTEKTGCFDFMLTCAFVARVIFTRSLRNKCFHFAPVASRLLAAVLEDRFAEIFETDSGWEQLMAFCRNVHFAVFPSKKNRPRGYEPASGSNKDFQEQMKAFEVNRDDSSVNPKTEDSGKPDINKESVECNKQSAENKPPELKFPETSNDYVLLVHSVSDVNLADKLMISCVITEDESPSQPLTSDATYWDYSTQPRQITRTRLTNNPKHLNDVTILLQKLEQSLDDRGISSDKYYITLSDDEDTERFEMEAESSFTSERKVILSDEIKEQLRNEIYEKKNKSLDASSSQNRVQPGEKITDAEIYELFDDKCIGSIDERKCNLCKDKMGTFINKWLKHFNKKYANANIVSDML